MARFCLNRRVHRQLALAAAATLLLMFVMGFFARHHIAMVTPLVLLSPDDCDWKLSLNCHFPSNFTVAHLSSDPAVALEAVATATATATGSLSGASASATGPAPHPHQDKIDYIKHSYTKEEITRLRKTHRYYETVMEVLHKSRPKCHKLDKYPNGMCQPDMVNIEDEGTIYSERYLSRFLKLSDVQLAAMTESHTYAVENLPHSAPEGMYKGDGIVYVGGGRFNWLALLSIRSLRAQECNLPVEVFVPSLEEMDLELCSRVFPLMNARCVHLPTALVGRDAEYGAQFKFHGYQFKCLAILLSSFENVLLLDSDNIPVHDPTHVFTQGPFPSKGLVVWPDFWHRSTSPDYFKIANVVISRSQQLPKYDESNGEYIEQPADHELDWENSPLHERVGSIPDPSSETGQLLISKKTHIHSLLVALYYNIYGPGYYYPLFSQGAPGEGDKETFIIGAVATKKPFYQVGKFVNAIGNFRNDKFNGNAMSQHDPVEDFEWNKEKKKLRQLVSGDTYKQAVSKLSAPKVLFMHCNIPKLNPWSCLKDKETVDETGQRYRLYSDGIKGSKTDFELDQWNHMHQLLCDLRIQIDAFKHVDRDDLCREIEAQRDFLMVTGINK